MATMRRIPVPAMAVAFIALLTTCEASADALGKCAHQKDLDKKIASCVEASKSTSYPWILQWVYRDLARAYRERGDIQKAIASYEQSLAAEERESVRREMQELVLLTQ
jgi:hypothetical protein